ncbi:MAG: hypothetical protein BZY88_06215 [SAR202 cluster bacterium Io17-Chloro-G9]|nr:MAG: hypothetical protein BZY88_06215 [SAR202 cluster bacterium Io17-Chloro-G9]
MVLQRSALHSISEGSGAKFHERFGWELPAAYFDVLSEYQAATMGAALHDVSYMGRLKATGADGLDLLNRLSTNKVIDLEPGQGAPTVLTTDRGRILDVISVISLDDYLLLTTSPGLQQPIIDWLDKYTIMEDLTVEDVTEDTTMMALLGPDSQAALAAATGLALGDLEPFHSRAVAVAGRPVSLIGQPLGALPGFALVLAPEDAPPVWERLTALGACPMGVDAYEAVRVRYGVPVHGQEMGDSYNPLEAGLIGSIDFAKGCYIGQEVIARLDTYKKVQKRLVSLRFSPDTAPSAGADLQEEGKPVGTVTSAIKIPTTEESIGLGYVRSASARVGNRLELVGSDGAWVEVLELPELFGPEKG